MRARHPHKGFTLIELMIVIAIIAVLLSLALPAYQDYTIRAKVTEGLSISAGLKTYIAESCMSDPTAGVLIGMLPGDQISSTYVETLRAGVEVNCSNPAVAFQTRNTGAEEELVIGLIGNLQNGNMSWSCYIVQGDPRHVPANCREPFVPPVT